MRRIPPLNLIAHKRKKVYDQLQRFKLDGLQLTARAVEALHQRARQDMLVEWQTRLRDPRLLGRRTIMALLPHFEKWFFRPHGQLTFHMTQILTGHGCFESYLCRIGKAPTPHCEHCSEDNDTAQNTLQDCDAWTIQRTTLKQQIGDDLTLPRIVASILVSSQNSQSFALFCTTVMTTKETAEKTRQQTDHIDLPCSPSQT